MWECKHCKETLNLISVSEKANHSRWCDKNPKRDDWKKHDSSDHKFGKRIEFVVPCATCSKHFTVTERTKLHPQKEEYFCSRKCANSRGGRAKAEKYGISQYKTIARKYYKEECVVCGTTDVLDVHHIDKDRTNNTKENLVFLCPNDHARLHRFGDKTIVDKIRGIGDRR